MFDGVKKTKDSTGGGSDAICVDFEPREGGLDDWGGS